MVNIFRRFSKSKKPIDENATKGKKAINAKYQKSAKSKKGKDQPIQDIHFKTAVDPIALHKLLQKNCREKVDPDATIFLDGVLKYVGAEIVELSYNKARERTNKESCTIAADDIKAAIETDEDLGYLFKVGQKAKAKGKKALPANMPAPSVTDLVNEVMEQAEEG